MNNVFQMEMVAREHQRDLERTLRRRALLAEALRSRTPDATGSEPRIIRYLVSLALLLVSLVALVACGSAGVPYGIDKRPLPAGENLEVLLPPTVGAFSREAFAPDTELSADSDLNVTYTAGDAEISVGFGITADAADARSAIATTRDEAIASAGNIGGERLSLDSEPGYFKVASFISWSRGRYFYYAHAGDAATLDRFMQAFPY